MAKVKPKRHERDYVKNGLLYCYRCQTPKEYEITYNFGNECKTTIVPVMCDCEKDEFEEQAKRQAMNDRAIWKQKMIARGLGRQALRECTFENDDKSNPKITEICQSYVDNYKQMYEENIGLLLAGDVGTGKTFYSLMIANALIDKGTKVKFTNIAKEINNLQNAYPEERQRILDDIINCHLLILDDVGAERNTSYAVEQIYNIINSRYEANKPLIVTTNLSIEEFENVSDVNFKRIYDRINSMCQVKLIVPGKSKRITKTKEKVKTALNLLGVTNEKE